MNAGAAFLSSLKSQSRLKLWSAARGVFSDFTELRRRNQMWANGRWSQLFLPNYPLIFTNISQFGHVAAVVFIRSDTKISLSDMITNVNSSWEQHNASCKNKSHVNTRRFEVCVLWLVLQLNNTCFLLYINTWKRSVSTQHYLFNETSCMVGLWI